MAWQLKVIDGPDRGLESVIDVGEFTVGRELSGAGLALSDTIASRLHARFLVDRDGSLQIEDLGSTNGTFVNEQLITGPVLLQRGDEVLIGNNRFYLFQVDQVLSTGRQDLIPGGAGLMEGAAGAQSLPITEALAVPFSGRGILKLLIGAILSVIPVLSFFAEGYRYSLIRNGIAGQIEMPEWHDWGELFIKGLLFFVIKVVYLIPALLLFLLFFFTLYSSGSGYDLLPSVTVFILVIYAASYFFLPMGLANYAATGEFARAFQLRKIVQMIRAVLPLYLLVVVLFTVFWVLIAALSQMPVIGWVFAFISFLFVYYVYIFTGLLFGELYRRGLSVTGQSV
jgi:hypothetical protein